MSLKRVYGAVLGTFLLLVLLIFGPGLLERAGQEGIAAEAAAAGSLPSGEREGKPNLLIGEQSPYLLQHANNPVEQDNVHTRAILREVHRRFIPNKIVVLADGGEAHKRLASRLSVLSNLRPIDQKSTAYICDNYVCSLPTNEVEVVSRLLGEGGLASKR